MKTVWIINHYADIPENGKFTRHYNLALKLIERGYKVKVFTASTVHTTTINYITDGSLYKERNIDGVDFVFIRARDYTNRAKMRPFNMIDYAVNLLKTVKDFGDVDVVYASAPHTFTWYAARRIARKKQARFLVETRDLWPETFVSMGAFKRSNPVVQVLYAMEKDIYESADHLIFTMAGGWDYIKERGYRVQGVSYINNGVDLKKFHTNEKAYASEDFGLDPHKFNILYTGAMGNVNRVNYLIEAMELLKDENDIVLSIFGSGAEEEALKAYCRERNLDNVVFKGRVPKDKVPAILAQSQLNIIVGRKIDLYRYGVSLNKMFEYFAAGKPILSNLECEYDMIEAYHCGKTVKGESAESLAEGIRYFKGLSRETYDTYCDNAKKAAVDFDFDTLTDKLENCF